MDGYTHLRPRRRAVTITALAVVAVLGLAGAAACSSSDAGPSSSGMAVGGSAVRGSVAGGSADSASGSSMALAPVQGEAAPAAVPAVLAPRKLVVDGSMSLTVADVLATAVRVRALATGAGGYVADEQTGGSQPSPEPTPLPAPAVGTTGGTTTPDSATADSPNASWAGESVLTLEVPSTRLSSVMGSVAGLGRLTGRTLTSQDVTSTSIDVASRLATQRDSVARIRDLLGRATKISDIVSIENELSTREATLESMEAQLKNLDDSVAMSTLTVSLNTPTKAAKHHTATGFVGGLDRGWDAFTGALSACLTGLGAALPFLVVLALLGIPTWRIWRRRSARGNAPALPGADAMS